MNRNISRSYDEQCPYQFINPVHSFLMESVHEQRDFSAACFEVDAYTYLCCLDTSAWD